MGQEKMEVLKGTLDMLILKVVAFGPIHGYAISQRIQQISRDFFQVPEGSGISVPGAAPAGRPRMAASQVGRNGYGARCEVLYSYASGAKAV